MKTFKQFVSEVSEQTQQPNVNISPELMDRMKKVWGGEKPNSDDPYWYQIPMTPSSPSRPQNAPSAPSKMAPSRSQMSRRLGVKEQVTCAGTNCGQGPKVDNYGRPLPDPDKPNYNTPVIRTTPGPKPSEGLTPDPTLKKWDAQPYTWAKKKSNTKIA